jgi:hypothetical protein
LHEIAICENIGGVVVGYPTPQIKESQEFTGEPVASYQGMVHSQGWTFRYGWRIFQG